MKKYLFLAFQLFSLTLASQVTTRIVQDNTFRNHVEKHASGDVVEHNLPKPNVEQILIEDAREGRQLQRFAIKIPANFTKNDGIFFETNTTINWKLAILSESATSLNYQFKDIHFPEGTEMYIYSQNRRMIIGPITEKNVHEGVFASDMVYGDHAIIEVIIPKSSSEEHFDLRLNSVSYGILPNAFTDIATRGFGESLPCNNDINCPVGDPWADVRDGVAMIQVGGDGTCSGSLVTDECESGRPYFLTAFHCLNGVSGEGVDNLIKNSTFRFFYESPTCDGPEPLQWTTFSGANFRAGWTGTDFLLLELLNQTEITPNRVNPDGVDDSSVAYIHHPQGDVKKISTDNGGLIIGDINNDSGDNYLIIDGLESGVTERGSSGAPLFDNSHTIISQHRRVEPGIVECVNGGSDVNHLSGRIASSWLGGGTNETSLEPWLGDGLPPDNATHIIGPDVLCESGSFCVNQEVSFMNWQVTPSWPFVTKIWSGGECLDVEVQSNYSGWTTVRFWGPIEYGECSPGPSVDISKTIWVGPPHMPEVQIWNCENELVLWFEENYIWPEDTEIMWETWNEDFGYEVWTNTQEINLDFFHGVYQYKLTVSNICGEEIVEGTIELDDTNCKWPLGYFAINPNPVENSVSVLLDSERYSDQDKKTIKIFNQFGNMVYLKVIETNILAIDVSALVSGSYYLNVIDSKSSFSKNFVKL